MDDITSQFPRMIEALISQIENTINNSKNKKVQKASEKMLKDLKKTTETLASQISAVKQGKVPNQALSKEQKNVIKNIGNQFDSIIPKGVIKK